ncbi:MAG: hypothetical protein HY903_12595 [Deltaproteobacteria bacterium]|nr:hypothetical protein [Deltaproteobacteria bacterium]
MVLMNTIHIARRPLWAFILFLPGALVLSACSTSKPSIGATPDPCPAPATIEVETLGDLTAAPPCPGMTALVRGFYAAGDYGGGAWYWDDGRSKAEHNGGTVVDPTHSMAPGSPGWWDAEHDGRGVWIRELSEPVDVRWFGAVGDGAHDDTQALQKVIDFGTDERQAIFVPGSDAYYRTTYHLVVTGPVSISGDPGRSVIRNEFDPRCTADCYWPAVPIIIGTYGAHEKPGSATAAYAFLEHGCAIEAVLAASPAAPVYQVALRSPDDASRFTPGGLVALRAQRFIHSGAGAHFFSTAVVNEVIAVDATTDEVKLTLKHPLLDDFERCVPCSLPDDDLCDCAPTAGAGAVPTDGYPTIHPLNTGSLFNSMVDARPAALARGVTIYGMTFERDPSAGQTKAIHLACYECSLTKVVARGYNGITGNPVAYSRFDHVVVEHRSRGIELAYLTSNNLFRGLTVNRIADNATNDDYQFAIRVGTEDGGADNILEDFTVYEWGEHAGSQGVVAVLGPRGVVRNGAITNTASYPSAAISIETASAPFTVDGVTLTATTPRNGLVISGQDVSVSRLTTQGTSETFHAIVVNPSAQRVSIRDSVLGIDGARSAADSIYEKPDINDKTCGCVTTTNVVQYLP